MDKDGNKVTQNTNAAFNVTTTVTDWTDASGNTLSSGGAVLVKKLVVKVHPLQVAAAQKNSGSTTSRDAELTVEMVRPAS